MYVTALLERHAKVDLLISSVDQIVDVVQFYRSVQIYSSI